MKKEVGSKLANSVRQAKAKQPKEVIAVTSVAKTPSAAADVVIEAQATSSVFSSRRVWPD
ncbi:MAG: hypothetical protein COB33_010555 [Thiotrichaceae bacterium]|nr:hypothetical protein [Thiotrichaceae bacterium]PCI11526.1 MAG: hypothetical protein COB71_11410 [Thiotrichales bacterium]